MSDTESFEYAMKVMRENLAGMYANGHMTKWGDIDTSVDLDQIKDAHDREIRDVAQLEYDRGFNDGRHSMDAEHRAVAMRLRALPMNKVGYAVNLFDIEYAVCNSWNDVEFRDKLIDLLGGVSEPSAADVAKELMDIIIDEGNRKLASDDGQVVEVGDDTCACAGGGACAADCGRDSGEQTEVMDGRLADDSGADTGCGDCGGDLHMAGVTYDTLENERYKAVCELKKLPEWYRDDGKRSPAGRFNVALSDAIGVKGLLSFAKIRDRLIHLIGGDQPSGIDVLRAMEVNGTTGQPNGTCPNDGLMVSITDELREWAKSGVRSMKWDEFNAIADRIDEQFDRICQQQEAVLQSTIDEVVEERDHWRQQATDLMNRADAMEQQCDELQAKLDEYDRTHTELPMDKSGEVFHIGCTVRMVGRDPEVLLTVHSMTMCDDGEWFLCTWDDKDEYWCNLSTSEFEVCDRTHDTIVSIVHDLIMNNITESQAVERIEALNG